MHFVNWRPVSTVRLLPWFVLGTEDYHLASSSMLWLCILQSIFLLLITLSEALQMSTGNEVAVQTSRRNRRWDLYVVSKAIIVCC